jgi:hypothetical protein
VSSVVGPGALQSRSKAILESEQIHHFRIGISRKLSDQNDADLPLTSDLWEWVANARISLLKP